MIQPLAFVPNHFLNSFPPQKILDTQVLNKNLSESCLGFPMVQPKPADSNPEVCSFLHPCYTWVTYHHQLLGHWRVSLVHPCSKPCSTSHLHGRYSKITNQIPSSLSFQWFFMTLKTKLKPLTIVLYNLASVYYICSFSHGWGEHIWGEGCILGNVPRWDGSYGDSNSSVCTHESTRQLVTWQQFSRMQTVGDWKARSGYEPYGPPLTIHFFHLYTTSWRFHSLQDLHLVNNIGDNSVIPYYFKKSHLRKMFLIPWK